MKTFVNDDTVSESIVAGDRFYRCKLGAFRSGETQKLPVGLLGIREYRPRDVMS